MTESLLGLYTCEKVNDVTNIFKQNKLTQLKFTPFVTFILEIYVLGLKTSTFVI